MAAQGTLDIEPPHEPRLDNFVTGDNAEVLTALRALIKRPREVTGSVWLCGGPSTGKSHLLRAAVRAASAEGLSCDYVGCADATQADLLLRQLALLPDELEFVALDDLGAGFDGSSVGDGLADQIFRLFERVTNRGGSFLVAHTEAAMHLTTGLDDLDSRLRSFMHFRLAPLSDEDKAAVLVRRAASRGYDLDEPVVSYWLARGPRDLDALLTDLDRLSRASLRRQARVTIPLLKDELGY